MTSDLCGALFADSRITGGREGSLTLIPPARINCPTTYVSDKGPQPELRKNSETFQVARGLSDRPNQIAGVTAPLSFNKNSVRQEPKSPPSG